MKALALGAVIVAVMLVLMVAPPVARARPNLPSVRQDNGVSADVFLDDEMETATNLKHGHRNKSSGLVPIGDHREMYLECVGTGFPTVVLISGFRGAHDDWTHVVDPATGALMAAKSAVFPKVSKFTRVCAYDRPGTTLFGGPPTVSSPVPQPTTADDGADDLYALLSEADEPGPFVVVAHSWGGLIARRFVSIYQDDVVGLVLLDPGSEFLESSLTPAQWTKFALAARELGDPPYLEAVDYVSSVAALRAGAPIRRIPAVVLSSDKPFDFGAGGAETWPPWVAAQDAVASLLHATHVTHTSSGHFIQGEQPKLVTMAIRKVVNAASRTCVPLPRQRGSARRD